MKLKLDSNGNVVLQDGKPVYVMDDGSEVAFDAPHTRATITRLNAEAKQHREAKEAAEAKLASFGDIDPAKAREALNTVSNLDAKKLVDAGKVEELKAELNKSWEAKHKAAEEKAAALQSKLDGMVLGGEFTRSKFISDKLVIPADIVQATFGSRFKLEDGKVVAYDANGQKVYSKANPGELAAFDEALEAIVSQYPARDAIMKATQKGGSGAPTGAGAGAGSGTAPRVTRSAFDALSPQQKAEHVKAGGVVVDN